jgi:hypothetical protein
MKIICDSQEEYDNLMTASKYLHDFVVWKKDNKKKRYQETGYSLDQAEGNGLVGFFCHLYLEGRDFPNKNEMILIKEE